MVREGFLSSLYVTVVYIYTKHLMLLCKPDDAFVSLLSKDKRAPARCGQRLS